MPVTSATMNKHFVFMDSAGKLVYERFKRGDQFEVVDITAGLDWSQTITMKKMKLAKTYGNKP